MYLRSYFFGWKLTQKQLVLITQTDAIAEQLQLDREPMQGKGIFNSLCFKLLVLDRIRPAEDKSCAHHSSPRKRLIVRFFSRGRLRLCTGTPQSDLWCLQVLGKNKLGCGSLALLAFLPASSGINDRRIWISISLGRSLPPFRGRLQLFLVCG